MRVGFVSRTNSKDPENHVVLGVQMYNPDSLGHQMSLSSRNMWGNIKWAIELIRKHAAALREKEGVPEDEFACKFVILKHPNRGLLALYRVPMDAFEESDDSSSDDDSGS